ncbi:MAG: hypothetical protein KJ955_08590 [Nanoarchaeota archaeon]|nr:hypothetical protein [Nanoarchaeota archaeon]
MNKGDVSCKNMLGRLIKCTEALKRFSYEHNNTIDGIFLIAYSIEQTLLVILTFTYQQHMGLIISLFVIIAFLTFGMQKLMIEGKNKYLERQVLKLTNDKVRLKAYMEKVRKDNMKLNILIEKLKTKGLNKVKSYDKMEEA